MTFVRKKISYQYHNQQIDQIIKRYNFYPKSQEDLHNPSHPHLNARVKYKTNLKNQLNQ